MRGHLQGGLRGGFVARLAKEVIRRKMHVKQVLNVNLPHRPASEIRGVRLTRLGTRVYRDSLVRKTDPRGRDYYWIGGKPPGGAGEPGTDLHAVAGGYVSVTPIELDLTNHALIEQIAGWGLTA